MKKISKRLGFLKSLVKKSTYSLDESLLLVKSFASTKFIESVEVHISLNLDPKYPNQQLRGNLVLPHGTGKKLRIAVLTQSDLSSHFLNLGAQSAGLEELIEKISNNKIDFDLLLATPDLMPKLAKIGKILGPKGLMPSPKAGTVSSNLEETLKEFQKGKIEYKIDKTGILHLVFGKVNFSIEQLRENLFTIYNSIIKHKTIIAKGRLFNSFTICTTMSPSIKLDINTFKKI
jgi:large subunit ribosomal protein L1